MISGLDKGNKCDTKQESSIKFQENLEEATHGKCYCRTACVISIECADNDAFNQASNLLTELYLCPF